MPKRHNNIIYRLSLRSKKTIKATLSSITRIRLIIYIEDFKEASSVDYIHIKEDTEVEETTRVDIVTTTYPVRSNTISIINLNANQVSIQQKIDNKYTLSINNMFNTQKNRKLY
jgi:hypothetical protein